MGRTVDYDQNDPIQVKRRIDEYNNWKERQGGNVGYKELALELSKITGGDPIQPNTMSGYIRGKNGDYRLSRRMVNALSKIFGCLPEYLLGEINERTQKALLTSVGVGRVAQIEAHLQIIELLGYDLNARLFLLNSLSFVHGVWVDPLQVYWKEIKPTLTKAALALPINDEGTKTFADYDGAERITKEYSRLPVRRTIEGSGTADYTTNDPAHIYVGEVVYTGEPKVVRDENGTFKYAVRDEFSHVIPSKPQYTLEYEVFKDGKRIAWLTMKDLENAFSHFDHFADLALNMIFEQHQDPPQLAGKTKDEMDSIHDFTA